MPKQIRHIEIHIESLVSVEDVSEAVQSLPFSVRQLTLRFSHLQCSHSHDYRDQSREYNLFSMELLEFDLRRTAFTQEDHSEESVMECFLQSVVNSSFLFRNTTRLTFVLLQEQTVDLLTSVELWKQLIIQYDSLRKIYILTDKPTEENVLEMVNNLTENFIRIRNIRLIIESSIAQP